MSSKRKRNQECIYCGKVGPVTDDHIPPQCLFAGDGRTKLIKVPACLKCNSQASKDDEYFRLVLTLREDVKTHPDVKAILPVVMRSLRKPEAETFRTTFLRGLEKVHPITPGGLILPERGAYTIDWKRLATVIQRITRGLFYEFKGHRLPEGYEVLPFAPFTMEDLDQESVQFFNENFLEPIGRRTGIVVGRKVFLFKFIDTDTDPNSSMWLYLFYERIVFFAFTGPFPILPQN